MDEEIVKRILENQLAILNMLVEPYDDDYRQEAFNSIRLTLRVLGKIGGE